MAKMGSNPAKTERLMGQAGLLVLTMHLGRAGEHEPLLTSRQDRD